LAARNNFFIIIKSELVGSSRKPNIEDNLLIRFLIKGEIYYLRY
jgi:hypothetical protein